MDDESASWLALWRIAKKVSFTITRSVVDAEDAASEALAQLLEAESNGMIRDREAWIVVVAKRRALDMVRRETRVDHSVDGAAVIDLRSCNPNDDVAEKVSLGLQLRELGIEIDRLTEPSRTILTSVAEGTPVRDVATSLGLTRRSAEALLYRARKNLHSRWIAGIVVVSSAVRRLHRSAVIATTTSAAVVLALATIPYIHAGRASVKPPWTGCTSDCEAKAAKARQVLSVSSFRALSHSKAQLSAHSPKTPQGPSHYVVRQISTPVGPIVQEHYTGEGEPADPVGKVFWCLAHFQFNPLAPDPNDRIIGCQ